MICLNFKNRYEVIVNGVVVGSTLNQVAREFDGVKVYTSFVWHHRTPGFMRNLVIDGGKIFR